MIDLISSHHHRDLIAIGNTGSLDDDDDGRATS
jgi:hypothetical protein